MKSNQLDHGNYKAKYKSVQSDSSIPSPMSCYLSSEHSKIDVVYPRLVVYLPHGKMIRVSWDDDTPNCFWKFRKSTNQIYPSQYSHEFLQIPNSPFKITIRNSFQTQKHRQIQVSSPEKFPWRNDIKSCRTHHRPSRLPSSSLLTSSGAPVEFRQLGH